MERILLRVFLEAAWPPAIVVLLCFPMVWAGLSTKVDWILHLLGGAAVAFCFHRMATLAAPIIGVLRPLTQALLAFGLSCAAALVWEFGEFFSDRYFATHAQYGLSDTMYDLLYGFLGAFLCIAVFFLSKRWGTYNRWQAA